MVRPLGEGYKKSRAKRAKKLEPFCNGSYRQLLLLMCASRIVMSLPVSCTLDQSVTFQAGYIHRFHNKSCTCFAICLYTVYIIILAN